jgi:phage host-nuclease inhibitor protein Gam
MKQVTFLNSWEEVGEQIGLLGQYQAEEKKVTGEIDEQIALVKTEKEKFLNELQKNIEKTMLRIVEYAEAHLAEIRTDDRKMMTFATGVIKTRENKDYEYPKNAVLVDKLLRLKMEYLVKNEPKADKNGIKAEALENPDIFKKLGIKVVETIAIDVEPLF